MIGARPVWPMPDVWPGGPIGHCTMIEPGDDISWDERYATKNTPWDSGQASEELKRVLAERRIGPCEALEIGCGTGTNAVYLAQQGFTVTAVDVVPLAVEQARERARRAG